MKKRTVLVFCGLILLLTACGQAATPTLTATLDPTITPTATLAPTNTPTPTPTVTPTATPNATATQAAKATQQMEDNAAKVKQELEAMGIPVDTGSLAYYQGGPTEVKLTDFRQWEVQMWDPSFRAADFVLMTDVTWEATNIMWCGLVFRSDEDFKKNLDGDQYEFNFLRLSGLPAWDIELYKNGAYFTQLDRYRFSKAIDMKNGATNRVVITAVGDEFTVYINGVRQSRLVDSSGLAAEGYFGYTAYQETGESSCKYENTAVWVYK